MIGETNEKGKEKRGSSTTVFLAAHLQNKTRWSSPVETAEVTPTMNIHFYFSQQKLSNNITVSVLVVVAVVVALVIVVVVVVLAVVVVRVLVVVVFVIIFDIF